MCLPVIRISGSDGNSAIRVPDGMFRAEALEDFIEREHCQDMNIVVMGAALFVGTIVEHVVPAWAFLGQAEAPVIMSIVVYYALSRSVGLMLAAAMAGGVLCDSMSRLPPGYSVLCFCVVGAAVRKYRDIVFSGKWVTHMFFGAVTGVGYTLMLYVLLVLTERSIREAPLVWVALKVAGTCALGVVMMPLVFRAMHGLDRMMGNILAEDAE